MNWNAIAAVGEIVAALAVFVSVLYLARQIRESALASVSELHQGISQSFQGINELLASSPDLADIMVRGAFARSELSPAEMIRFDSLMTNFFNIVENLHRQYSSRGLFTPQRSEEIAATLRKRLIFPGVSEWWSENTDDFSAEFVQWVEASCAAAQQGVEPDVE
jgi:hypothetical protein